MLLCSSVYVCMYVHTYVCSSLLIIAHHCCKVQYVYVQYSMYVEYVYVQWYRVCVDMCMYFVCVCTHPALLMHACTLDMYIICNYMYIIRTLYRVRTYIRYIIIYILYTLLYYTLIYTNILLRIDYYIIHYVHTYIRTYVHTLLHSCTQGRPPDHQTTPANNAKNCPDNKN